MSNGSRRPMDVSPLWLQAMLLTFVVGFAILGYLALRVHSEYAPVPGRVVDEAGRLLITRDEIMQGQEAFLTHGLMQFGSVYGHGAYLGPDFTADYLHRQAELMRDFYGGGPDAEEKVRRELQSNRYDEKTDTLVWMRLGCEDKVDLGFEPNQHYLLHVASHRSTPVGINLRHGYPSFFNCERSGFNPGPVRVSLSV